MVLTTEERIALLARAREAKAKKKAAIDALKPIPIKGRPRKKVEEVKEEQVEEQVEPEVTPEVKEEIPVKDTFKKTTKNEVKEVEETNLQKEDSSEDEIIIEEIKKKKKKKKKIIRRIIEESSSSDDEIQEIYIPKTKSKKVVKIEPEHIPKPVNVQKPEPNPFFCY
jgi:hypothetical protein